MERGPTDYLAETVIAYIRENEKLRLALRTIAEHDPSQDIQWAAAVARLALDE